MVCAGLNKTIGYISFSTEPKNPILNTRGKRYLGLNNNLVLNMFPSHRLFVLLKVVGSQARILYSDQKGRTAIALAFNNAVTDRKLKVS